MSNGSFHDTRPVRRKDWLKASAAIVGLLSAAGLFAIKFVIPTRPEATEIHQELRDADTETRRLIAEVKADARVRDQAILGIKDALKELRYNVRKGNRGSSWKDADEIPDE